jgi:hypothetical protein
METIEAIRLPTAKTDLSGLNALFELPPSTILEMCGEAFSARMIKVRLSGRFYLIFLEDIEPAVD